MDGQSMELTIMFADVSGSTSLYEVLGNQEAKARISLCLNRLIEISKRHQGTLVKTIGDEIMCYFPDAAKAVQAAGTMQEETESEAVREKTKLGVGIGFHHGPVLHENDDVFGDAVNVAARMAAISKAGQIITTESTVQKLPSDLQHSCRLFDRVKVKGKKAVIAIYQVLWAPLEATSMVSRIHRDSETDTKSLQLRYRADETEMTEVSNALSLGRDVHCDLVVATNVTSRHHAWIQYQRGKFVLSDQSTNGTTVKFQNGESVYLRREDTPLYAKGVISLGKPVSEGNADLIYFTVSDSES